MVQSPLDHLTAQIGECALITDPDLCRAAGQDWRGLYAGPVLAMAQPECPEQAAVIVRWANDTGTVLVPQGGNSSLVGGATPLGNGPPALVLSSRRLRAIRTLDKTARTVTVEAGVVLETLQARVAPLEVPLDLGGRGTAQIGGLLACHAGGLNVIRYGSLRTQVHGLEAVLPTGAIWNGLSQVRKDNSGYDLKSLLIGSEGTLGFITAATLQLFTPPSSRLTALVGLPDPHAAVDLLKRLEQDFAGQIYACELMPALGMQRALEQAQATSNPFGPRLPAYSVLIEIGLRERLAKAETALALDHLSRASPETLLAQSAIQATNFWALREGLVNAQKAYGPSIKHDICVPLAAVPTLLTQGVDLARATLPGCTPVPFGHLGDGSFHFNVSCPAGWNEADLRAKSGPLTRALHDLVHGLGGSISAEHGVGQARRAEIIRLRDPAGLAAMRAIKAALDPNGLFNPGKVV